MRVAPSPRLAKSSNLMKAHFWISFNCIFVFSLALAACSSSDTNPVTPSPSVTPTPLPSVTPSPLPTNTPSPLPPTLTPSPTIPSTPTPLACWTQPGRWERGSLSSDLLPLPLEYTVYLPPCYDQQTERRYPVLYMLHGQNSNNDQWDRLGIDEAANALIASEQVPPFIIVLPRDRSWEQPAVDKFGQVLADKLVPYIDAHYRTLPERAYRAIGGLSRGAGWAIHLGLSRWKLFGAIGAHSLPIFWEDTAHIRQWLKTIPSEEMPRIYLDIGDKDRSNIMDSVIWFEKLLTKEGIPHEWHLFPGYHAEAYWQAHVEQYLLWYTQDWGDKAH